MLCRVTGLYSTNGHDLTSWMGPGEVLFGSVVEGGGRVAMSMFHIAVAWVARAILFGMFGAAITVTNRL